MVRTSDVLSRIGKMAELFDDFSPLQLQASGVYAGRKFTLVGRLQYKGDAGVWTEWAAFLNDGTLATLGEDNGAYVVAFDAPLPRDAPQDAAALDALRAGQRTGADGRAWEVASKVQAKLIAAQGELPTAPRLQGEFTVVDLRNSQGEVATLDASDPAQLHWSVGRSVKIKRALLVDLMSRLGRHGIDSEQVMVCFKETAWENWSFAGGRLLHA